MTVTAAFMAKPLDGSPTGRQSLISQYERCKGFIRQQGIPQSDRPASMVGMASLCSNTTSSPMHQPIRDAPFLQQRTGAIDGIPFSNGSQIPLHPRWIEANRFCRFIKPDIGQTTAGQPLLNFVLSRNAGFKAAIAPQLDQGSGTGIKGLRGLFAEPFGSQQQLE